MIFITTALEGAFIIDLERRQDARGSFARTFCVEEFAAHGLNPRVVQCNVSANHRRGTLRGMHWQAAPRAEAKLVRVTRGAVADVIVDLRPRSATYLEHLMVELTHESGRALYVPEGFAHGFQTLADETDVFYQMTEMYAAECARGARWNDPAFRIAWPLPDPILSERDRGYPDLSASAG